MIDAAFDQLVPLLRVAAACRLLGKSRATHYRHRQPPAPRSSRPRPTPPNALSDAERAEVVEVLHRPEFVDLPPAQVWARLLDAGMYLCSIATMYRLLRARGESRDRRGQRSHPARVRPELVAHAPQQVWTWDITKLRGPERGVHYALYVILDIFSRYIVAWTVAAAEDARLAERLIADATARCGAPKALHADRGGAMTSKPVAQLLVDLGVTRSHSRPRCSNDNPYSEAQFKTLKYCPDFPERFGSLADARAFCADFFDYYNHEHRHTALGLHTPASIHHGTAVEIRATRQLTLDLAYAAHPDRFAGPPQAPRLPTTAWINQPTPEALLQTAN